MVRLRSFGAPITCMLDRGTARQRDARLARSSRDWRPDDPYDTTASGEAVQLPLQMEE